MLFVKIFTVMLFFRKTNSVTSLGFPKNAEDFITLSVVRGLGIKHCVHIKNEYEGNGINNLKWFSERNIQGTIKSYEQLFEYFKMGSVANVRTMIVAKVKHLVKMEELLELLKNVSC